MAEGKYFVLHSSEDGTSMSIFNYEELIKEVLNTDDGEAYFGTSKTMTEEEAKKDGMEYWPSDKILIIKGKVVIPKPIKVVKEFEVE